MSNKEKSGNDFLFEIGTFLITSAKGCLNEPKSYGPLRLLTAYSKLVEMPDYISELKKDEFLLDIKGEIDNKVIPEIDSDPEVFEEQLKNIIIKLAKEIKKRKKILT